MTNEALLGRILAFMEANNISKNALAVKTGSVQVTLYRQLSGKNPISADTICKILESFPEVSAEWLLRGTGAMIGAASSNTQVNYGNNSVQAISSQVTTSSPSAAFPGTALYANGVRNLDEKAAALAIQSDIYRTLRPVIPDQLLRQPGQDIYDFMLTNRENINYEPNIPQLCEYTATCFVSTDSLSPEVRRGDRIFVKLMPSKEIISGNLYLITDNNRGAILRHIHEAGSHYLCKSLNPEKFSDMKIRKSSITSVWAVVGALKAYL